MQSLIKLFILVLPLLVALVFGQGAAVPSNKPAGSDQSEDLNLVTVHAEDAHLPSILAILA